MKRIVLGRWPGARPFAVTFSYDDGRTHDLRLIDLLNRYGFKGTFHLNSGTIGKPGRVSEDDIRTRYTGHEIAVHTVSHPMPVRTPDPVLLEEVVQDRRRLEALSGTIVDGMSYPFGNHDARFRALLRASGIVYSRTTHDDRTFGLPEDWLQWHPTCHDRNATPELIAAFFKVASWSQTGRLLYIWGHSYEFDREGGWESIEAVLKNIRSAGGDTIWAATNREIYTYAEAVRGLEFAADASRVRNPSATPVWIDVDGQPVAIPAGGTVQFP